MSTQTDGSRSSIDHAETRAVPVQSDPLMLLGRILLGGIFVVSGYGKLMGLAAFAASLEKNGVPFASALAPIGACVEFFGGLAIVLGLEVRYVALLMISFAIVATLLLGDRGRSAARAGDQLLQERGDHRRLRAAARGRGRSPRRRAAVATGVRHGIA